MSAPRGVSFHVPLKPVSVNRRYVGRSYRLSPEYRAYHEGVKVCAKRAMRGLRPLEGPLSVDLTLLLTNPRQDIDGPAKPTLDACNAVLWGDDSQVVELRVLKLFCGQGEKPGITVYAREMA
jgi:Holliday junction resolvase RusA-like endonuclease